MTEERKEKYDIDFELRFFEGILKRSPDFVAVMEVLAEIYTLKGRYADGLKLDEALSLKKPEDPIVLYNLACSYSLVGEVDKSYRSIKKAVSLGYDDLSHLEEDSDLNNLRKDPRFQSYYKRLMAKRDEQYGVKTGEEDL